MTIEKEKDFLARFSPENLLRLAPIPDAPTQLRLPTEYAQPTPDMLGMEVDRMLGAMGSAPKGAAGTKYVSDKSNAALAPFTPQQVDYDGPIPKVGKDLGLGDITEWIRKKESTGNYQALNKEQKGNTASGAYQYTDATWNGFGGYPKAMLAPKHVQDQKFALDLRDRATRFGGDPFRMIAAHYLPAAAGNDPRTWTQPYKLPNGKVVKPVASYVAYVVKGTPLEQAFHAYLNRQ